MRVSIISVLLLGLVAPFASAMPTELTSEVVERDDFVNEIVERDGFVVTPHGERPVENVHQVPDDGHVVHVNGEIHLVNAKGEVVHVAVNDNSTVRPAFQTGWIANANWYNTGSSPVSFFTTKWSVPKNPATYNSQTVFLFNAIEPASGNAILQPVLQYGPSAAGGGKYWTVASWYLVGSQVYHTSLKKVYVGKSLTGVMKLTSVSGSSYSYTSAFTGISGTTLTVKGAAQLVWCTETLEAYGITKKSNYPTGSTVFYAMTVRTKAGIPSVHWNAVSDAADGITTRINRQGATNAQVTIKY